MNTLIRLIEQAMNKVKHAGIKGLVFLVVALVAGPEILISMELFALVEVLGASTFLLVYWVAIKSYLKSVFDKLSRLESPLFFMPSNDVVKVMPSMLIHAVPGNVLMIGYLGVVSMVFGWALISI